MRFLGKIVHVVWSIILRLQMIAALPASLFRRRANYIEQRWDGVSPQALEGKVCVFVHFDRKGVVHDFVLHYLQALRTAGFRIVFVSNAPRLDLAGLERVRGLAALVLRRKNLGYDFGAYKDGIAAIPDLGKIDRLLLANDSVYGPFSPLAGVLDRMDTAHAQFWSVTDCWDIAYHLQSYFLLFGREAIGSEAFKRFWSRVRYVNSKRYVIHRYEVGLSQSLIKAGLRGAAICNSREAGQAVIEAVRSGVLADKALDEESKEYLAGVHRAVQQGAPLNMSHSLWDYLIVKMGCPFIKRELLQRNPVSVPFVARWQQVIRSVSDYDTDLIVRHLERTLRNRAI